MDALQNYHRTGSKILETIPKIQELLQNDKQFVLPSEQSHTYNDKFKLVEDVVNSSLGCILASLRIFGMGSDHFSKIWQWQKNKNSVKLVMEVSESCAFVNETKSEVESGYKLLEKSTIAGIITGSKVSQIIHTVVVNHWKSTTTFRIFLTSSGNVIELFKESAEFDIETATKDNPRQHELKVPVQSYSVNISSLLDATDEKENLKFSIDRNSKNCRTPTFNDDFARAAEFFKTFSNWVQTCQFQFSSNVFLLEKKISGFDMVECIAQGVSWVPVVPLLEKSKGTISQQDFQHALGTFEISIRECFSKLPNSAKNVNSRRSFLIATVLEHLRLLNEQLLTSFSYIEGLIAHQLVDAIGKIVKIKDLNEFMDFHYRHLFHGSSIPRPVSIDIRRPGFTPEGTLELNKRFIEDTGNSSTQIVTFQRLLSKPVEPLKLALSASNNVQLAGSHYIHGYMAQIFSTEPLPSYSLAARARQFSSFILMIGTIGQSNSFICSDALIVKNKEEVIIPLLFETLPSAKEFNDAISSLSPEQQRFAKSFREMQLASTVFSVVIIQIKPQMEKVLCLPAGALTKEIELTQDLMELFIEYQIPSDLLSYSGDSDVHVDVQIENVKKNVANVKKSINYNLDNELKKKEHDAKLNNLEAYHPKNYRKNISSPPQQVLPLKQLSCYLSYDSDPQSNSYSVEQNISYGNASFEAANTNIPFASAYYAPQTVKAAEQSLQPENTLADTSENITTNMPGDLLENEEKVGELDFLSIPKILETKLETIGHISTLRPTKIKVGTEWKFKKMVSINSNGTWIELNDSKGKNEKKSGALDLLDAITRSGDLTVDVCDVHVFYVVSNCFDKCVFDTVVTDNVNPIDSLEISSIVMASTLHETAVDQIVAR